MIGTQTSESATMVPEANQGDGPQVRRTDALSSREKEVAKLLAEGLSPDLAAR